MTELLANPWIASLGVIIGCTVLIVGGETLVRGASKIAYALGISPLIVGLTIVAVCTSAPEMAVSFAAAFKSHTAESAAIIDVAMGNVVGSNICNILLILGLCAVIRPIKASKELLKRDAPVCCATALLLCLAAILSSISSTNVPHLPQWFGAVLLLGFVLYTTWLVICSRKEQAVNATTEEAKQDKTKEPAPKTSWLLALVQIAVGLGALVFGADLFVTSSVCIARSIGVSELVIGLTLVALGTSLPELTVSAISTLRNQADFALGNVFGSNICNILLVLGGTLVLLPKGMPISGQTLHVDLPVMTLVTFVVAWFCYTGRKLVRWEGAVLLAGMLAYDYYLLALAH
ncbi:MAG: calcium/sodium antiporter [Planctomycetia bacterium]|nr:calcium/sodium antiporter [Planctomycetia bacterium]